VSCKARRTAQANRERRERQRDISRSRMRREWLGRENDPALGFLLAAALYKLAGKPERRQGRQRGPRFDPTQPLKDYLVASAVEDARRSGQSHKEAIDAGIAVLRRCGSGASSPKSIEAMMTRRRKTAALTPDALRRRHEQAKARLRDYGLDVTGWSLGGAAGDDT
jgi:hypothetical protein